MPYIPGGRRLDIDDVDCRSYPENAGELNYRITSAVMEFFRRSEGRYQDINDIIGALEGAKQEFYRRVAVPYEEKKMKANGDVYE